MGVFILDQLVIKGFCLRVQVHKRGLPRGVHVVVLPFADTDVTKLAEADAAGIFLHEVMMICCCCYKVDVNVSNRRVISPAWF